MAQLKTRGLRKTVGVPGLFATAYGNVGSSIYYLAHRPCRVIVEGGEGTPADAGVLKPAALAAQPA